MIAALLPAEMDAAKRALDRLKAPLTVMPSPHVVKAALERLAPAPAFSAVKASTPAAKWAAEAAVAPPPAPMPMPPPRRSAPVFPPGERFVAGLEEEAAEERRLAREASKLEPITIVISDQQELQRIHELARRCRSKPIPMIRCHLRGWSREKLDAKRASHCPPPEPLNSHPKN